MFVVKATLFFIVFAAFAIHKAIGQTKIEDIQNAWRDMFSDLRDLSFVAHDRFEKGLERKIHLELIGNPAWRYWKYRLDDYDATKKKRAGRISSYDGRYYYGVQHDGLGFCLSDYNAPNAYMSFIGIYLDNLGLGPAQEGARSNWEAFFSISDLAVSDDPARPGTCVLRDGIVTRELSSKYGFMPIRNIVPFLGENVELVFDQYAQIGNIWLPQKMNRIASSDRYVSNINDFKLNQGLKSDDMRVQFPFGMSVIYDGDVTRIYGTANIAEAEEGLQNWLMYSGFLGRKSPQTIPIVPKAIVAENNRKELFIIMANGFVAAALLLFGFLKKQRRPALPLLILIVFARPHQAAARMGGQDLLGEQPSAACCIYLIETLYAKNASLPEILASLQNSNSVDSQLIASYLAKKGIHARDVEISLEQLKAWPYPAIIQLKPRFALPYTRYAVILGEKDGGHTLCDPNTYGRLAPYSDNEILQIWTGKTILTAPTPIIATNSFLLWKWVSVVFLLVGALYLSSRLGILNRLRRAAPILMLYSLIGCDGQSGNARPSNQGPILDHKSWSIKEAYPGVVKETFVLRNNSSLPLKVLKTTTSCGCIAGGLPFNVEIGPGGAHTFELAINLSGARDTVQHTIQLDYSNGASETISFTAYVRRGVYSNPEALRLDSVTPGEVVSNEVRFVSDDNRSFDILATSANFIRQINVDNASKTVRISFSNNNKQSHLTDTLTIETNHPFAKTVRVPVVGRFELTWEIKPSGFYFQTPDDADHIERTVQVVSRQGTPFLILSAAGLDVEMTPLSNKSAPAQTVRLKVNRPRVSGTPKREAVILRTTLPDAAEIEVPFVFYR